jgi:methyl-galactoside transport system ATP-binding protein
MVSNNSERSGEFLLEMSNINKSFPGVKALDNVNLKVRPHSIHALMGENGAGKSTLLKCLLESIKKIPVVFFFREKRSISIPRKKRWKTVFQWFTRS